MILPQFNNNLVESFEELKRLEHCKSIETLFLQGNPLAKHVQYRNKIVAYLPSLKEIDSTDVYQSSILNALTQKPEVATS